MKHPLPHDDSAEMSLLGALIHDSRELDTIDDVISGPDDLYREPHRHIFRAIHKLHTQSGQLDIVLLQAELENADELKSVGGVEYLIELARDTPSSANAPHYAAIVARHAQRRRVIEACGEITHQAQTAADDVDVPSEAERLIYAATAQQAGSRIAPVQDTIHAALEKWLDPEKPRGLRTGFAGLDRIMNPMAPGDFVVIGAGTSQGKSVLAMDLALNNAMDGHPVAVFPLEMTAEQLQARWVSKLSQVPLGIMLQGVRSQDYRTRITDASSILHGFPIYIDDSGGLTLAQFVSRSRRLIRQHGVKLLVVDYLQLMQPSRDVARSGRTEQIGELSRGLKAAAQSLGVPIVCPSQLNRNADNRDDGPKLHDLRESGSIEQDASVVLLLHRPNKGEDNDNYAVVEVAKQRNGALGELELLWNGDTVTFSDAANEDRRIVA